MKNKKNATITGLALLLILVMSLTWIFATYHLVDGKFYRKDTKALDLRGRAISVSHYEKLKEKMPEIPIRWDVPFQNGILADDTAEVTVRELTEEDVDVLVRFLPGLRRVHGEDCPDIANLALLKEKRPGLRVDYRIPLNGKTYAGTALRVTLNSITEEELALLAYLPLLKTVTVTGGDPQVLQTLRNDCLQRDIEFRMELGGEILSEDVVRTEIRGISNEELTLLQMFPKLKKLHLVEPEADGERIAALENLLPEVAVTWEKTVLGVTFPGDAEEIDLTDVISREPGQGPEEKTGYQYGLEYPVQGTQEEIATAVKISKYHPIADRTEETKDLIAEVEAAMAYFPKAKRVLMVGGLLHNVYMDRFREAHREDYKVVWSVQCGNVLTRSDATFFMPVKYHVYYLSDEEAYNLRYLEDAVAVDIGHMAVSDISFVEYMPKLEYLILAHTNIQYIEPIRSCKNLKFLEVDWTGIRDLSPLLDCTSLEDLNVGNTGVDLTPLKKMTWLKNLWAIFRGGSVYPISQALVNTRVVSAGTATVDSGWRDLPNYFAMRDQLKMYYMSW